MKIDFSDNNAPLMYLDQGQVKGLYVVMVQELFNRLQIPVTLRAIPWNRALSEAYLDQAGIAGLYWGAERASHLDYTDQIYSERILVYTVANNTFPFNSMSDLKHKKLAVSAGFIYGEEFERARAAKLLSIEVNINDDLNFEKLVKGRVDAVVASEDSFRGRDKGKKLGNNLVALPRPVATLAAHLAFAKGKHRDLISQINKTIGIMKNDGSWIKIIRDWSDKN